MKIPHVSAVVLLSSAAAFAVLEPGSSAPAQAAAAPGPEHRLLEKWSGCWKASVGEPGGSGAAPASAKSCVRIACGGLWMVTDYEGTAEGEPFSGHEVRGFDPASKKYVVNWVDSMTSSFDIGEGSWDEKTKTMTFSMKTVGPDGKPATWRQTDVWNDADTHVWTMYRPGPDGKEAAVLEITYRREK